MQPVIKGDVRAVRWIFDVIEVPARATTGDARSSRSVQGKRSTAADLDPVERARMRSWRWHCRTFRAAERGGRCR